MLDDTGEKNAAKEPPTRITFFCLAVYTEKVSAVAVESDTAASFISIISGLYRGSWKIMSSFVIGWSNFLIFCTVLMDGATSKARRSCTAFSLIMIVATVNDPSVGPPSHSLCMLGSLAHLAVAFAFLAVGVSSGQYSGHLADDHRRTLLADTNLGASLSI